MNNSKEDIMNGIKAMLVILAMCMIVDGMSTDTKASSDAKECAEYTRMMSSRLAKQGYVSIVVDCKRRVVTKKLKAWEVEYDYAR